MSVVDWRDPESVARWAAARVLEDGEPMMLFARAGVFQGPPEWRLLPVGRVPSVGLGWVEVASIHVERAAQVGVEWYALLSLTDQCAEAVAGF